MAPFAKIYTYPQNWRVHRAQILGAINGVEIEEVPDFTIGVTNKTPEYLAKNPIGKVPLLETPSGFVLPEGGAIALFAAESGPKAGQLLGTTPETRARIAQWIFFTDTEIAGILFIPIEMVISVIPYNQQMYDFCLSQAERALSAADKAVAGDKKFLVGDQLTAADVSLASCLAFFMAWFVDAEIRDKVPALMAYVDGILKLPEVAKYIPKVDKIEKRKRPAA